MFKLTDNLAAKTVAGLVGAIMAVALTFGAFVPSQAYAATDSEIAQLCANAAAAGIPVDTGIFAALCADTSSEVTAAGSGYIYHLGVDYMFNNNLRLGARGVEVQTLQRALNDGGYTVATSGAGSAGLETTYFGPATQRAVIAFQTEQNIQPNIGNFYPLTRAEFNKKGAVVVDEEEEEDDTPAGNGDVSVEEGDELSDEVMPLGVVRFPVTEIEITAGDDDVTIETITVEVTGNADANEVIDSVVALDENGNIVGDEDSVDNDDEARLDLDLDIEEGETVVLTLAVNASSVTGDIAANDGLTFSLDVVDIDASGDVDGLPVVGSGEMTVQDNIELGDVEVRMEGSSATYEIGEEEEDFGTLEINADPDDNDDSVYVMSVRLENTGTGDLEDLDNVFMEIDGEEFDGEIDANDDDYIVFDFGNDGFEIEESDTEDFDIYADVAGDSSGDTFIFTIDENQDIFVLSEDGYGMPVDNVTPTGPTITVGTGDADLSNNDDEEGDEISVGDDIVLGIFDFEIEGEALEADTLTVTIVANGDVVTGSDADDLLLEDVFIADEDGNALTDKEDADGTAVLNANFTQTIEFDDVEFPVGDHEGLQILATIDDNVKDGATFHVDDIDDSSFSGAEGSVSGDTITIGNSATFDERDVEGAVLDIEVEAGTPSEDMTTDDVDEFHMATVELDAQESGEDVEVSSFELDITFAPFGGSTADLDDITNCRIYDEDNGDEIELTDEVEPQGATTDTNLEFAFDEVLVVKADEKMKLEVRCDLSDDFTDGDTIVWSMSGDEDVDVEAVNSGNDDFATIAAGAGATITIAAPLVDAAKDSDSPDAQVVKLGDDVVLGILEIETDNGEATIDEIDIQLSDISVVDDEEVFVFINGSEEENVVLLTDATDATFTNLNIQLDDGEKVEVEFRAEATNDAAEAGNATILTVSDVRLDDGSSATLTPAAIAFDSVTAFEGIPVIELVSDVNNDGLVTANDVEVFEFLIEADGEDVTVDAVTFNFSLANVALSDALVAAYEDAAHTNEAGTDNETPVAVVANGNVTFTWATAIEIPDGDTYYFVLEADTTVSDDVRSLRATIEDEAGTGITISVPALPGSNSDSILEDDIEVVHKED